MTQERTTKRKEVDRTFAENDAHFKRACLAGGIEPTTRQASKFRRGRGLAFKLLKAGFPESAHIQDLIRRS